MAHVTKPLYDLLQKGISFIQSEECDKAFNKIKMITLDKVLGQFNPNLTIHLTCNTSLYGISSVLSHIISRKERSIVYISHAFNKAESNNSQVNKEALTIIWSAKKLFNNLYNKLSLNTNHKPLKFTFDPKKSIPAIFTARLQRCTVFLMDIDYNIEFCSSKSNANVDSFSCQPLPELSRDINKEGDTFLQRISGIVPN